MTEAEKQKQMDLQLQADWEDVGGRALSAEQVERIAVTMFGCPEIQMKGKTLVEVVDEAGMLKDV